MSFGNALHPTLPWFVQPLRALIVNLIAARSPWWVLLVLVAVAWTFSYRMQPELMQHRRQLERLGLGEFELSLLMAVFREVRGVAFCGSCLS
jgi:hypothetical protein